MLRVRSLIPFFAMTFGLAWSMIGLLILFPGQIESIFGELSASNPLFILAVYSPAIAAFVLVTRYAGLSGLRRFLSRLLLWRVHWGWYLFLVAGVPILFFAGAALKGNLTGWAFPFTTWQATAAALSFMLVLGPIEEFGWRGFALPMLQRRFAPIWAGLVLGVIWGLWHLPAFFLSGVPQSAWSFTPFLVGSIAVGVIVTPLFNSSRGSILLPLLLHWQLNNPIFPDAAPHDTAFFVAAAIVVTILNRRTMFDMGEAVTEVIPMQPVDPQDNLPEIVPSARSDATSSW